MRIWIWPDEQVVAVLRETDRNPVATVAKRHGVSEQTIYTWRQRFETFQADDVRRLKQLEVENARLKKLPAERDLELEVMKDIAAKGQEARSAEERRAVQGLGVAAQAKRPSAVTVTS